MLQHLQIKNYALIENLNIDFQKGFSVITGETGAGKSIIMGALGLLLGNRADIKAIHPSSNRCVIEASFQIEPTKLGEFWTNYDLEPDGDICIVRREVLNTGKSRSFVNDTPVPLTALRDLSNYLVDIHSQHQNLLLNDRGFLLNLVDTMANNESQQEQYAEKFQQYSQKARELEQLEERIKSKQDNLDFLQFQLNELQQANLQTDEQEELEEESKVLDHAEEIKEKLYTAEKLLQNEEYGILTSINQCVQAVRNVAHLLTKAEPLVERLESCAIELDDLSQEISSLSEDTQFDPKRQEYVNNRLDILNSLEHKYHQADVNGLIKLLQRVKADVACFTDGAESLNNLRNEVKQLLQESKTWAAELSDTRKRVIPQVECAITQSLAQLGMPYARFQVEQAVLEQLTSTGCDALTFLFSANKGLPLRDLTSVASGGEIARVMLSLKALIAQKTQMGTIIFDEIDTGVSGRIAEKMALAMKAITSGDNQVISITHLPQIAAKAQFHYLVYKTDDENGTHTAIRQLEDRERVQAIASMLSGEKLTPQAISNAVSLLKGENESTGA